MPIQIDVTNGNVSGGTLTWGCNFEWVNPTSSIAKLTCCGGFSTQASYDVPAATSPTQPGITAAQLNSSFEFVFGNSAWNVPGMPHIVNPPSVVVNPGAHPGGHGGEHPEHQQHPGHREKDVA